jgi:hypothetical protein
MSSLQLCSYCTAFAVGEVALYFSYRDHDARFHWFLHFFVGASAALVVMSMVAWRNRRAVRFPLVWILAGHLFAMAPDLLFFVFSVILRRWMDVFLWHIGAHFVPGQNWTWYAVFLACLALYLAVIAKISVSSLRRNAGGELR